MIAILLLFLTLTVSASESTVGLPKVRNFPRSENKAGTQNWAISQDQNGIIYFANNDGLLSFNGVDWNLTRISSSAPLRSLLIDSRNTMYVGLINDFGIITREENRPESYQSLKYLLPEAYKEFDDIWKIFEVDGGIVFQCFQYIFFYKDGEIKVTEPQQRFHFSYLAGNRLLVHEPGTGLFEFSNGALKALTWWKGEPDREICNILQTDTNTWLIGTRSNGLFQLKDDIMSKWNTPVSEYLNKHKLFSCIRLPGNLFAFGTILNGLVISDSQGNIVHMVNEESGLGNNTVLSLLVDHRDNLWVGLDNGIDYLEINSPLAYIGTKRIGTGYCCMVFKENLYLGTNQGLYVRPLYVNVPEDHLKLVENTAGQVWTLEEINGQLFCGHALGSFIVDGVVAKKIPAIEGVWKYLVVKDHPGLLIAGYYEGLLLFRKVNNEWVFDKKIEGFEVSSRYLFQDRDGYLWVGHSGKGIYRIQLDAAMEKAKEVLHYSIEQGLPARTQNILFDFNGSICVSTTNGIYTFQPQSNTFAPSAAMNEIFGSSGRIKYVATAGNGINWFIAELESGYVRENEDKSHTRVTVPFSKLRDAYVNEFEFIYPYNQEHVFVGTEQGFVHYNPLVPKSYDEPFSAYITRIELDYLDSVLYFYSKNISKRYEFPFENNSFRFYFASPFFENERPMLFSFFLEGYSEEWSDWSADHYKDFNTLREGSYILKLKARNVYGTLSETTSFHFEILPPWWRSVQAYVIYLLFITALSVLLARYIIHRVKRLANEQKAKYHREIEKQEARHQQETLLKEKKIINLKNEKLQAEMIFRDKELANQTMAVIEKNRFLKSVNDNLQNIQDFIVNETARNKILGLKKQISKEIDIQHQNRIFETYFDEANEELFRKLKERFPELTTYDLRLCAFIRMNISTKEIASILNISYRGAEVSRYRLRKKMQLPRDVNLSSFLAGL